MNIVRRKDRGERRSLEGRDGPNYFLISGSIISALMAALILVGFVWTPYGTTEMSGREKFMPPCLSHPLGTDLQLSFSWRNPPHYRG